MDEIVRMTAAERGEVFSETAARKSMSSAIAIEKDFWVCWTLARCFEPATLSEVVFKGGTSLSKAYHAISRFSEDIDLSIPRRVLGFAGATDLAEGSSKTKQKSILHDMSAACTEHVGNQILPELKSRCSDSLDTSEHSQSWQLELDVYDANTILFTYPPALSSDTYGAADYIRPTIRLEFGGRSEVSPAEEKTVQPYCTEVFPAIARKPTCKVQVLAAERTFWEKATLLHSEYYRPSTSTRARRVSRHYSDLARLSRGSIGQRALGDLDLLRAVALHKEHYYPASWARYPESAEGALRLVPHESLAQELNRDYEQMREMFFEEPEPFEEILKQLSDLERTVNTAMS
jgi:hypothetical protein